MNFKKSISFFGLVGLAVIGLAHSTSTVVAERQLLPIPTCLIKAIAENKFLSQKAKIALFIEQCGQLKSENKKIPAITRDMFRVATYNVHFFMEPDFQGFKKTPDAKQTYEEIMNAIRNTNADVIALQEVTLRHQELVMTYMLEMGYVYSHFQSLKSNKEHGELYFGSAIFSKVPMDFSHEEIYDADRAEDEKRGYINSRFTLKSGQTLSLYATHLDVWDETEQRREQEVEQLMRAIAKDRSDNIMVVGDLNAVRKNDYQYEVAGKKAWDVFNQDNFERMKKKFPEYVTPTRVHDIFQMYQFVDSFSRLGWEKPKFTVWNGTAVDFMYLLQTQWKAPITGSYVYYDAGSDHLLVCTDITTASPQIASKL